MSSVTDLRAFTRVTTAIPATVITRDGVRHPGMLRDIALRGAFVLMETLPAQAAMTLVIELSSEAVITAHGFVVRGTPEGVAIAFDALEGPDSYEHLRRLVLMNTRSPAETESAVRQISKYLGLCEREDAEEKPAT